MVKGNRRFRLGGLRLASIGSKTEPLLVDSYAVLASQISAQCFKTIRGRNAQVVQLIRDVELQKFPVGDRLDIRGWLEGKIAFKHLSGLLTTKTLYHNSSSVMRNYVKRNDSKEAKG